MSNSSMEQQLQRTPSNTRSSASNNSNSSISISKSTSKQFPHKVKSEGTTPGKKVPCPQCHVKLMSAEMVNIHLQNCPMKQTVKNALGNENGGNFRLENLDLFCELCNRSFISPGGLKTHTTRMHNPNKELTGQFECNQCPYRTPRKSNLAQHERTHLDYPHLPYACKHCGLRFRFLKANKEHEKTHEFVGGDEVEATIAPNKITNRALSTKAKPNHVTSPNTESNSSNSGGNRHEKTVEMGKNVGSRQTLATKSLLATISRNLQGKKRGRPVKRGRGRPVKHSQPVHVQQDDEEEESDEDEDEDDGDDELNMFQPPTPPEITHRAKSTHLKANQAQSTQRAQSTMAKAKPSRVTSPAESNFSRSAGNNRANHADDEGDYFDRRQPLATKHGQQKENHFQVQKKRGRADQDDEEESDEDEDDFQPPPEKRGRPRQLIPRNEYGAIDAGPGGFGAGSSAVVSHYAGMVVNACAQSNLVTFHDVDTMRGTIGKITFQFQCNKCRGELGVARCLRGRVYCVICCGHPDCD